MGNKLQRGVLTINIEQKKYIVLLTFLINKASNNHDRPLLTVTKNTRLDTKNIQ